MVEQATRRLSYQRRLPAEFGGVPLVVSPSAGLRYLLKPMSAVDPALLRNVQELVRAGDVVWDIGANIGLFAFAATARAGRGGAVVAFEPDTWLVQLLRRSARLQNGAGAPVTIVPAAVAAEVDLRRFLIASRSRASNSLSGYGHSQQGDTAEEHIVPTFNLDWLLAKFPAPNVLKCDVEGAEVEVFAGQARLLDEVRPVIVCEVGRESSPRMTQIFHAGRYRLYDGQGSLRNAAPVPEAVWNTIAIPEERVADFVTA